MVMDVIFALLTAVHSEPFIKQQPASSDMDGAGCLNGWMASDLPPTLMHLLSAKQQISGCAQGCSAFLPLPG
jgi:hypothetical protein